jgi:hypothetical protein
LGAVAEISTRAVAAAAGGALIAVALAFAGSADTPKQGRPKAQEISVPAPQGHAQRAKPD